VFVLTDDQGPWALGAAGNPDARTPNLDRLASEGARLTNCFVVTPVCSPSRAALMTGRYSTEVDILDFISGKPRGFAAGLNPQFPTWPRRLSEAGYVTALIGKWHLGRADRHHPTRFGYDEFVGFRQGAGTSKDPEVEVHGQKKKVAGYTPDILTDFAIDFVRRQQRRPFLLSLHFWAPHANTKQFTADRDRTWLPLSDADWSGFQDLDPKIPNPDYPDLDVPRVKRMMREYLASVASVDRNVGRLLQELDVLGLARNTLVVFTSDHGYNMGHNGIWHKGNGRWILVEERGSLPNLYDNSLRVPAIVRLPEVIAPGTLITRSITQLDWYATLLAAARLETRSGESQYSRNFLPLLMGDDLAWDDDIFAQYSMRHATHADLRTYRTPRWKLVRDFLRDGVDQLYDLSNDPSERQNLIASTDPVVQRQRKTLDRKLREKMRAINDPASKR
jgi:uncharacterized sulfatase